MYKVWEAFIFSVEQEVSHTERLGEYEFMEVAAKYVDSIHYFVPEWGFPLHVDVLAEKRTLTKAVNSIGVGGEIHRLRRVGGENLLKASSWHSSTVWVGTTEEVVPTLAKECVDQLRVWTAAA